MRNHARKLMPALIVSMMAIGLPAVMPSAANAQYVSTFNELQSAINDFGGATNDTVITVDTDFDFRGCLTIPAGRTLTIRGAHPGIILKRGVFDNVCIIWTASTWIENNLFAVAPGATLILEDIIIDGGSTGSDERYMGPLVYVDTGGEFTMNGVAVLRNNMSPGGSGVYVEADGTFTMTGGSITGNTSYYFGGGVEVRGGTFTMTGGSITGNTAAFFGGGVYASGTFTMTGGEISGNTAEMNIDDYFFFSSAGGGVYVYGNGGTFTMSGGEINGNTADYGGGVYARGAFTMTGGSINGNIAEYGGGVYVDGTFTVDSGKFTMNSGEITGNTADYGGGVYVANLVIYTSVEFGHDLPGGEFTMTGGLIADNTASGYGGGVYGGTCTISGGLIAGNTASGYGGGVYVNVGEYTMTGGEISDNIAESGGGVYVGVSENGYLDRFPGAGLSFVDNEFTLGGTAAIRNNINDNVYLGDGHYITLGADGNGTVAPSGGMEVWVTKPGDGGVIVESGATPGDEVYFFADESGKTVVYGAGQLLISIKEENEAVLVGVTPSASVKKLNGNKNDLTITVKETFSDGSAKIITATFSINNNAAGSYKVGTYNVYVDTKGNDQIRQCYIR